MRARLAARALLLAALALVVAPPAQTPAAHGTGSAPAAPEVRQVILVSFDGVRADALQAVWPVSLGRQGVASWTAQTTMPSTTLPAHTSMVTGVGPDVHGVRFNDWSPGRPRLDRATIFTEARRAGRAVHLLIAKPKLRFLVPEDVPLEWLAYPRYRAGEVVARAVEVFVTRRPALLFVHIADPDDVGHAQGWMSPPYLVVVGQIPVLVDRLLRAVRDAGVWDQTLVIVTSDHGGHGRTHGTARAEDMTIPWIALGGPARAGATLTQPIVVYDTAPTVLHALGLPVPAGWQGRVIQDALATAAPAGR